MFVFAGTDRRNASLIVETNTSVPIGAAARVPISSGAIVVLQVANGQQSGTAQFSYKVVGTKYNWYEKAFIGKSVPVYRLFLAALCLAFLMVICCPCACMLMVKLCRRACARRKTATKDSKVAPALVSDRSKR